MEKTGIFDKNGCEIQEGDLVRYSGVSWPGVYKIKWGEGTYDSSVYTYIGFYCEPEDGDSDGFGFVLTDKSEFLEII